MIIYFLKQWLLNYRTFEVPIIQLLCLFQHFFYSSKNARNIEVPLYTINKNKMIKIKFYQDLRRWVFLFEFRYIIWNGMTLQCNFKSNYLLRNLDGLPLIEVIMYSHFHSTQYRALNCSQNLKSSLHRLRSNVKWNLRMLHLIKTHKTVNVTL